MGISKVFSIDGFKLVEEVYKNIYPQNCLWNFVLNIKTKNIHIIPEFLKTPNEEMRTIYLLDKSRENLFICYCGRRGWSGTGQL